MASENDHNDQSKGGFDPSRRRRKKPGTTIDLTATEIAAAEAAADQTGASAASNEPDTADPTPEAVATPDEASSVEAATPGPERDWERQREEIFVDEAEASGGAAASDGAAAGTASAEAPTTEPAAESTASSEAPVREPAYDAPPQPAAPIRQNGVLAPLAAAFAGGLVVLLGGAGLMASGLIGPQSAPPAASPETVAAIEARVNDLDSRVGELASRPLGDPALADRISNLAKTVAALPASAPPPPGDPEVASRVSALEEALKTAPPTSAPEISELRAELQALSVKVNAPAPDLGPRIDELAGTIENLRTQADETRAALAALTKAPPAIDPARIEGLERSVAELDGRLDGLNQSLTEARSSLEAAVNAVQTATAETATANGALADRVQTIETRIDAGPKGGEIAALSLAVTSLATKVAEGEPFAADLALVRQAAPDDAGLTALEPVAASGVDTVDRLAADFPVDAILAARPVDADNGVMSRMLSGAKSLVNYRETGAETADPTSKAIEVVQAALTVGDLPVARAAVDTLPDPARTAAAGWTARLDQRLAADAAVKSLTDRVLTRLQAPAEGQ